MQDFRKLEVWKKSYEVALEVYKVTRTFPREEVYVLTSQVRKTALSVPANIAEGRGRGSDAEFARFLWFSLGSANELELYLLFARDLGYLGGAVHAPLEARLAEVKQMLFSLHRSVLAKGLRLMA